MKMKTIALAALLGASLYAADAEMTQEGLQTQAREMIRKDASVDELIDEMNQAKAQERYRYMNAIKAKLQTMSEEQRAEAIASMQQKMERSKAVQQSDMAEGAPKNKTMEQKRNMIHDRNRMQHQQQQMQQQQMQQQMQQMQQMQGK
jgi:tRNA(Ile)-lysidine synthase TilS/MesJ